MIGPMGYRALLYGPVEEEPSQVRSEEAMDEFFKEFNRTVQQCEEEMARMIPQGDEEYNIYFHIAEDGILVYHDVVFRCNYDTLTLELGDCSDLRQCRRVRLIFGGSFAFNRGCKRDLKQALDMFIPEDRSRIVRQMELIK